MPIQTWDAVTLLSAVAATGSGAPLDMSGSRYLACNISGTFSATIQFESSPDGTNWFAVALTPQGGGAVVTSATAAGQWYLATPFPMNQFRCRVSAYVSGNVTAIARAGV